MNQKMGLLGRKLGMTQLFREEDGEVLAVTIVEMGPCTVTAVKTAAGRDRYDAIQLGFDKKRPIRTNKPSRGQFAPAGIDGVPAFVQEIRLTADEVAKHQVGAVLTAPQVFAEGEQIDVIGTSKGKGFAGVMKRHNFAGFERSHGVHEYFRHGGSIGTRLTPGMTLAGMPMGGQMGNERVTVQNLKIAKIDAERNLVYVVGGIPGPNGGFVTIRKAAKTAR